MKSNPSLERYHKLLVDALRQAERADTVANRKQMVKHVINRPRGQLTGAIARLYDFMFPHA